MSTEARETGEEMAVVAMQKKATEAVIFMFENVRSVMDADCFVLRVSSAWLEDL